jgi:hypothetical protein
MKIKLLSFVALYILLSGYNVCIAQTSTSWKGTSSSTWTNSANWTNGVPTATANAIIGDANFTGANQPNIGASSNCLNLTIGGTKTSSLTVGATLTINGTLTINSNGTLYHTKNTTTVRGDFIINGTYSRNGNRTVAMGGTTQSISGTGTANFFNLIVNAGSTVTLQRNVTLGGALTVSGTLNPNEPTTYKVTAASMSITNGGDAKVNGATFATNYSVNPTIAAGGVVEYSSTFVNQTISNAITYSTLRISGSGTKTLGGNLPVLNSSLTTAGRLEVNAGTLDMVGFTANRGTTTTGGTLIVANGATLKTSLAGNCFPINYATVSLSPSSTVAYYGVNQTVAAQTYGNILLTSNSGAAIKTMPTSDLTIQGSLTSDLSGGGTSVSYTAGSNISVTGNVNIASGTTFDASSFSHTVTGNWVNTGTLTGSTSSFTLDGPGASLSGTGVYNFNNLTISASGYTVANNTNISVSGNLATTGSGSFTHTAGSTGTVTMTGTSTTLSGTGFVFNNFTSTGTVTSSSNITVVGNLGVTGGTFTGTGTTITMTGTGKTINGGGTANYGSLIIASGASATTTASFNVASLLNVLGTFTATAGTVTFNGTGVISGSPNLYNVTINGTSLQLSSNTTLGIANAFTQTAGSFNTTSSVPNTVNYNGTGAQNVLSATYNNLTLSGGNTKTALGNNTINGDFTIALSTTFASGSYTHNVYGNYSNNGVYTPATSTLQFSGAKNTSFYESSPTTFNALTLNKTAASNTLTLLSNANVNTLTMTQGKMLTGSNVVTIYTTRSGNGIILGNIWRSQTFSTGTSYAFEGPNNTITFASVSGVTLVKVNVVALTPADYPYGGSISRQYTIEASGSSPAYSATLRLHYEDGELNGNTESSLNIWNYNSAWTLVGKTGNDATNNYVENSGITSLNTRWTLAGNSVLKSWNGSVSTDWSTDGNWTPSGVPASSDIVQIGNLSFTNQPAVSAAVSCQSIYFGSTTASTLTISSGSLTTNSINGSWSGTANHTIAVGANTLTVNGNVVMSDGTSNHTINLTIGSGTAEVVGALNQLGGANITFTGAGTLKVGDDYNYTSGTLTPSTGTVEYNGLASQIVASVPYYNLKINKTAGLADAIAAITVANDLLITAGELDLENAADITRNVTISSGATLGVKNNYVTTVGGDWTNNGTFAANSGTVTFNGTGTQMLSATTFNNLIINKASGTLYQTGNISTQGDISLLAGTADMQTYTVVRTAAGGALTVANGTTLRFGGTNSTVPQYSSYSIGTTSTIEFYGSSTQYVSPLPYGNLILSNGGSNGKIMVSGITVAGDLTINSGAELMTGANTIDLYGNFVNNGTFDAQTGLVILEGTNKILTGSTTFNKLTIKGTYTNSSAITITTNKLLSVNVGASINTGVGTININGDMITAGTILNSGVVNVAGTVAQTLDLLSTSYTYLAGTLNFNGSVSPTLNSTASPTFNIVNINNTAGVNPSIPWLILGTFTVNSGAKFNGGVYTHEFRSSCYNHGYVTSIGNIFFNPSSDVTILTDGPQLDCNGTVTLGGSGLITSAGAPTSFNNVTVTNTNPAGYTCMGNWYMYGDLTIGSNAIFHAGSYTHTIGGNILSTGTLEGASSTFVMTSPTAQLTTSSLTTFNNFTINSGATLIANSDFNVSGNFMNNGTFDAANSTGTLTMVGSGASIIGGSTTPSTIGLLAINKTGGATATLAGNISSMTSVNIAQGTLNQSTYSIVENSGNGLLTIGSAGTLQIGGTNTLPTFTTYSLDPLSTVEYNGAGTAQIISTASNYGNLIISNTGNKTANAALTVQTNFTLSNGTFIGGAYTHNVGGNWLMSGGTFTNTGTTINLNGTGAQTISSTGAFNNFTVNKTSGIPSLLSDITVNGALTLTNGILTTGTYKAISPSTGSVSRTNGWVNGNLQKYATTGATSLTFEVGDATVYAPITTVFASVTTAGNLIGSTTKYENPNMPSSLMNINKSVNRYWTLTNSGIGFTTATVTPTWVAGDVDAGSTTANFRIKSYDGSVWSILTYANALPTSIQATGCTKFGDFAVGEATSETQWTGNISSNWNVAGNWSSGIPDASTNVLIPSGRPNNPLVDATSGNGFVQYITIASGATLTVSGATLEITGGISNNGTFTTSNGTINLLSSASQVLGNNTFTGNIVKDLILTNDLSVTLASDLTVSNSLTLTKGSFQIGANTLTLNGSISATAGILVGGATSNIIVGGSSATLSLPAVNLNNLTINRANGATITGNVTVNNVLTLTTGVLTLGADTLILINTPVRTAGSIDASNSAATLEFNNPSSVTLPASLFSAVINNLYLKGTGGIIAGSNFTVNGSLNLEASNPSDTQGLLDMSTYTLTMGSTSSTIGTSDVEGIIQRTSIAPNTPYSFGNKYTTITISGVTAQMPTSIAVTATIGSYGNWPTQAVLDANYPGLYPGKGTNPIKRTYKIAMTAPSGYTAPYSFPNTIVTVSLHYLDSELNGLTESNLVTANYDVGGGTPEADEHGISTYNSTYNYISSSDLPLNYFIYDATYQNWYEVFSLIEHQDQAYMTWNGAYSSSWSNTLNWTPAGTPGTTTHVIIPDANLTNNEPVIPTTEINSITFQNNSIASLGSSVLTINGASGAWNNQGGNINPGTSTVLFTGAGATISGNTDFYNVQIADGASIVNQVGDYMRIYGNITKTGSGTGKWISDTYNATVEYAGANQTILATDGNPNYHTLILSGSGTKTLPSSYLKFDGDLVLSDTVTVTAVGNLYTMGNMVIGNAATFNTSTSSDTVAGNLRVLGNMNVASGGSVKLAGATSDFRVSYAGRLTNAGTVSIPSTGSITIVGNDSTVGQILNSGTINNAGSIRFDKDLLASAGWYFMSLPFDVSESNITNGITGNSLTWGDLTTPSADYYVARYDGAARDAGGQPNVSGPGVYWANATTHKFIKNQGYIVAANADGRLRFTSDNSGDVDLFGSASVSPAVTKATTNADSKHWSWNLMGNPFSAGFDLIGATQTDAPFYYFNGVNYVTVMAGDSCKIYPFTSFFLQAFDAASTITYNKNNISFKATTVSDYDEVDLTIRDSSNTNYEKAVDRFRLRVRDDATIGFDPRLDGLKFLSSNTSVPQLYCKYNGSNYSVNSIPKDTSVTTTTVPLTLYTGAKKAYTIRIANPEKVKRFTKVYLTDANTGAQVDLLTTPTYTFSTSSVGTTATRLALVLESTGYATNLQLQKQSNGSIIVKTQSGKITIEGIHDKAKVSIFDVTGRQVAKFNNVQNYQVLPVSLDGIYLIKVQSVDQEFVTKLLFKMKY